MGGKRFKGVHLFLVQATDMINISITFHGQKRFEIQKEYMGFSSFHFIFMTHSFLLRYRTHSVELCQTVSNVIQMDELINHKVIYHIFSLH